MHSCSYNLQTQHNRTIGVFQEALINAYIHVNHFFSLKVKILHVLVNFRIYGVKDLTTPNQYTFLYQRFDHSTHQDVYDSKSEDLRFNKYILMSVCTMGR